MGMSYYFGQGVEKDVDKSNQILLEGAERGDVMCRFRYAAGLIAKGDYPSAMNHFGIAARVGYEEALVLLEQGRYEGHVSQEEYDEVERACRRAQDAMRNGARERAKRGYDDVE